MFLTASLISFQLLDSASYFLEKAAEIGKADYLPSDEDVLRARSITTGVTSMDFMVDSISWLFGSSIIIDIIMTENCQLREGKTELKLELVDVGGQRGERRRWIHCFEGVDAGDPSFSLR